MTGHEVLDTGKMRKQPQQLNISIIYLEDTHCVDYGLFDGWCALDWEISQEVVRYSDQRVLRPALEPVHRAAGNETRKLERAAAELLADGREAERHVQVRLDAHHVVVVEVLERRRAARELLLHRADQFIQHLVHFVTREQVRHLQYGRANNYSDTS